MTLTEKLHSRSADFVAHKASTARAIVIVPILKCKQEQAEFHSASARLKEISDLARAIKLDIIYSAWIVVPFPKTTTLLGTGKVEELCQLINSEMINLVVVDHSITPTQQRNLEKVWNCTVIDRIELILKIFGKRAKTKEGVLQVKLAYLNHQKGRLVRSWRHLERQRGGSGFLGGPGETQIETDRRMLRKKINHIKRELDTIVKARKLHQVKRKKMPYPIVALVGYTNAGKSTLFNQLTGANVPEEDMLFTTLDPILRRIKLPHGKTIILSDTVGFISNLPTHLVAAFRATLKEVEEADFIIHVRDLSNPNHMAHRQDVLNILLALNVDIDDSNKIIEVWNKADLLDENSIRHLHSAESISFPIIPASALNGRGLDALIRVVENKIAGKTERIHIYLELEELSLLDWLYRHGSNHHQINCEDGGVIIDVNLTRLAWYNFQRERKKIKT
ncbi:MAG: GTP-binding protein HflX [Candidatus Tokpelaia sp. JSC188]|nr:MAG: GTP-binding protein HflX [Candidatus Tokpelaia sp. JSC188]